MKVEPQRYRISFKLNSIFFPFTEPKFSDLLIENGFQLAKAMVPVFPHGQRSYLSGRVAMKYDCAIDVDSNRQLIASEGRSLDNTINAMKELLAITTKEFNIKLKKELIFIELIANLIVTSENNPLHVMDEFSSQHPILEEFNDIMGIKTSFLAIELVPKGINPNSTKWFHIKLTPHHTASKKEYYVEAIYREKEPEKVLNFAKKINSRVMNLLKVLEGN